jgi:hypothetical protein
MQDNDDVTAGFPRLSEAEKKEAEERLEKGRAEWANSCFAMISPVALKLIVEIINTNSFCSLSRDSEIVQKLRDELVDKKILTRTDMPYIGCCEVKRG